MSATNRGESRIVDQQAPAGAPAVGWPPGLLQDDCRELSKALASTPGARLHAREAAAQIRAALPK